MRCFIWSWVRVLVSFKREILVAVFWTLVAAKNGLVTLKTGLGCNKKAVGCNCKKPYTRKYRHPIMNPSSSHREGHRDGHLIHRRDTEAGEKKLTADHADKHR